MSWATTGFPSGPNSIKQRSLVWVLHIDWVELGCRGWDIEATGAHLGPQRDNPWEWDYASLDRDTLHVVMSGRPAFIALVMNDLRAAGLLSIIEEQCVNTWNAMFDVSGTIYPNIETGTTAASCGEPKLRIVA